MSTVITEPITRSSRRWLALTVLALAQFLVILDASIVNIALPSIGADLALDTAGLSWVITGYILPFGGLLLFGGRLADRYGHRRVFLAGVAGFVLASMVAGFALSGGMLLVARAIQGASAALLAPASLALVTKLFITTADRAKALGIWGAVAGIGAAAGVLLGGVLTSGFGWQSVFFVNVPVGLLVLAAIPLLVTRDPRIEAQNLDAPGALTVTAGLVAIVAGLSQVEPLGFAHPITIGLLALGAALIATFVLVEQRSSVPLVPFAIFRRGGIAAGNLAMLFMGGATVALFFALSVYLQAVLGYTAMAAGLSSLPLAGTIVVTAVIVPSVMAKVGVSRTLVGSMVLLAGALGWLSFTPSDAGFVANLLGPTIAIGAAMGGAFISATQLAVSGVDEADDGLASGLVNTSQQIGGALGLAVLASLGTAHSEALLSAGTAPAQALTAGFSWVFIGASLLVILGAIAVAVLSSRRDER